ARGFENRPLNDNEGSPKPSCALPAHQSTAKLSFCCLVIQSLPRGALRASAADAKREPARQRLDYRRPNCLLLLPALHQRFFLIATCSLAFFYLDRAHKLCRDRCG